METRSRKRAEASSSAPSSSSVGPTTRASKRSRFSSSSSSTTATPATRSRTRSNVSVTPATMDESSSRGGRRGRNHHGSDKDNDKGKEKEHEMEKERENERERALGLNIDEDDDDNDNDDSEGGAGVGLLHQNLTSASSALQGLLRKLGAGLDDLLPSSAMGSASSSSHQSGRLKKILSGLRADGEDGKQVEALTQLCELLSIGTEDSLSTFSVDSFVPVLVGLLNHESNPDIMLLAARAITHLVDVLPSSCAAVVHYGAVNCFCARLLTIEYMDLAEQSLQALKKISQEHPTACLRAGALMAVLSYLDFFSTGVQRVALATAANMCKKLPSDAADFVMEAVPHLTNLLQYHDAKVLEHASVCLTRIVEAFASSAEKLDELCNHGLVTQAASLISTSNSGGGQASLSTSTYTGLIRLLATCASGSTVGAKTLLLLGISGILKDILTGSGLVGNMSVSPALSRPPEQIFEIVNLANELLPPLPQGTISLPASSNLFVRGPLFKKSPMSSSSKQDETNGNVQDVSAREKLLNEQPELLQQFGVDLLPVLIQIHGSSVNGPVRHKCLSVIGKLMFFSNADLISSLNSTTNISSFLSGVLAWKDPQVLVPALQIAEILMEKLPETFSKMFVREGVVHAVDSLIAAPSSSVSAHSATPEKESESTLGSSGRARRLRRRSGNQQQDVNSVDELKNSVSVSVGSPPTSVEIPTVSSNLRTTVSGCAKSFKDKYFPSNPGTTDVGISDDLLHLKNLCARLNAGVEEQKSKVKGKSKTAGAYIADLVTGKEENLVGIVSEMLGELSKGDGVSTFEFIGSGVVAALLNYFSCGYFNKEKISEVNLPKLRQQALKRYKLFISIALPTSGTGGNVAPMTVLVQKLQNALSSLERFPVVLSHSARSSGGSARLSSGLSALSQPFKLRLCRASGEKSLRDYSNTVVLIDPLASLAAVEDFLWPRVQRGDSGQKASTSVGNSESGPSPTGAGASSPAASTPATSTRRQSARSRSGVNIGDTSRKDASQDKTNSSSKGKGKAILKPAPEETKGPQTRNAARRRAASDKDAQLKSPAEESSSEDEDLEMSPVDIDDALVIEDDDISDDEDDDHDDVLRDDSLPACMADKVHDVKLTDSAEESAAAPATSDSQNNPASGSSSRAATVRGSDSTDFRSGSSFGSRGAMSFAAAAMAGLASNGRGIRGGRDRHGRPLGGSNDPAKLVFSAGGKQLNPNLTIYQAIQRQLVTDEEDDERYNGNDLVTSDGSRLWSDIYTITYQRAESQVEKSHGAVNSASPSKSTKCGSAPSSSAAASHRLPLDSILQGELPCDMEKNNPTYNILSLLRVLEGLNQLAPRLRVQTASDKFSEGMILSLNELSVTGAKVLTSEFVNSKLTPKLARQIQDALALCSGSLPSWCYQLTKACPFLFPFETRRQFFYSTAFGLSRALYRLQQQQGEGQGSNEREVRVGRLQRQKVRVSRNRILDSAAKVMEMYSSQKAVLEVEYFGEVGTGLGPTLEFYTLLSHDLQKVDLGMWRTNCSFDKSSAEFGTNDQSKDGKSEDASGLSNVANANLVHSPLGLFPQPWPPSADALEGSHFSKVIEHFRLLGRVMAKALQDGRLLDLPLSTAFFKLVLGQELDLHDILSFDPEVGKTLRELQALVCRKQYLESIGGDHPDVIAELCFRGTPVEDLCLDFTLPGYPDYVLRPGDENVDINNLEDYISLVVDATVKTGITRQMEAFRAGFNQVFDVTSLQIFSPDELDCLLCGRRELWQPEMLVDHIKFDHGYTAKSPAIVNLLEIMGEFTPDQQRAFCQFVTGAPRLPPGGLAVLNPKLTIVRKHSSTATPASNGTGASETADDDLPSVMTCANYLKLPPYSTKEVMYKKLLYAINEGQGSFDLS
ncbi:E3 ubiquitin-protein ligase UPL3 [Beta vulgaris subsp. vulgaris]|uniref:E3 ubiquitin-protein ligase UPL3 n=1 Tax=Beta vulgaris subsp. vulgaris TaxID=3555 RepID=UPI0020370769|nr:E3 ubiquitin-protein ligase UPL3 [Beta vulgaris subsp. vulgaris]XP_010690376.2 E3 ubiquitin-protein ligase UPL3 [Beta vulgaris subsp. vulgaris]XP_048491894.1 E3 ubiquitin-protein ligase UPL3 [Beta vulgaris subsp. vulgaris]